MQEALNNAEAKYDFKKTPEEDHLLSEPPKMSPFQCKICNKVLKTKQSFQLHEVTHVDSADRQIFQCEICEATFKSQPGLTYHLKTRHTPGYERKMLPCPMCGRIFKSIEGWKIHMTIQHGAGGPIFKCQECPMVFARKPHLDLHMTTHGSGLHVCTICGKPYARLKDLSRHEITCGVKELSCPVCAKQFRKEKALENHQKKCSYYDRNFHCLTCGQGFATEQALGTHEAVHRRTFDCAECPQTFVTAEALRNHEETKHWVLSLEIDPVVGEKRVRPKKNDSSGEVAKVRQRRSKNDPFIGLEHLANPSALIEEVRPPKVKIEPAVQTPKRFPCEHCPLKFVTKTAFLNHGHRRHWEAFGLAEPGPERRGRKRTRPLERVRKKVGRPRKIVNYVDPEEVPVEDTIGVKGEQVDLENSEETAQEEQNVDPIENDFIAESAVEKGEPFEEFEEPTTNDLETNEDFIKEEIIEFEEYKFGHFENDSTDDEFENNLTEIEISPEPNHDAVEPLAVKTELMDYVSNEPPVFKELFIKLEKLDYSALVEHGDNALSPVHETATQEKPIAKQNIRPFKSKYKNPYPRKECEHCGQTFAHQYHLALHRVKEHGSTETPKQNIRPFKSKYKNPVPRKECEHCGQTFAHQYHLALHRVKEHGSTETPVTNRKVPMTTLPRNFHCDQCDKSYTLETNLQIHKAKVHGVGEAPPRVQTFFSERNCKHCQKKLQTWKSFVYHLKFVHGDKIDESQVVRCSSCSIKFLSKEDMKGHVCTVGIFKEKERPFKCDLCGKAYTVKAHLENHYSVHPEYHNHKCDQCPKGFFTERELNTHKKSMHRPKELYYKCEICNKAFKTKDNLTNHREVHSDKKNYCCEHCGKKFKTKSTLKSHAHYAHSEHARAIPCTICGKTFAGKVSLRQHMKIHNNDRRHKCSFPSCEKAFLSSSCLKTHMQTHTKDYKYKCKFCEYGTVARQRILLHEKQEHNHNRLAGENNS